MPQPQSGSYSCINKCGGRRKPTIGTPPVSLVLTFPDPMASCCTQRRSGPGLSCHVSHNGNEMGLWALCRRYPNPAATSYNTRNIVFRHLHPFPISFTRNSRCCGYFPFTLKISKGTKGAKGTQASVHILGATVLVML